MAEVAVNGMRFSISDGSTVIDEGHGGGLDSKVSVIPSIKGEMTVHETFCILIL